MLQPNGDWISCLYAFPLTAAYVDHSAVQSTMPPHSFPSHTQEFPAVQRPYVLLLELCDSHTLTTAILSATSSRLRAALGALRPLSVATVPIPSAPTPSSGDALMMALASPLTLPPLTVPLYRLPDVPLGDRVVSMSTLALYLGYFSFAKAGTQAGGAAAEGAGIMPAVGGGRLSPVASQLLLSADEGGVDGLLMGATASSQQPLPASPADALPSLPGLPPAALDVPLLADLALSSDLLLLAPLLPVIHHFLWLLPKALIGGVLDPTASSLGRGIGIGAGERSRGEGGRVPCQGRGLLSAVSSLLSLRNHPALSPPPLYSSLGMQPLLLNSGAGDLLVPMDADSAAASCSLGPAFLCSRFILDEMHHRLAPFLPPPSAKSEASSLAKAFPPQEAGSALLGTDPSGPGAAPGADVGGTPSSDKPFILPRHASSGDLPLASSSTSAAFSRGGGRGLALCDPLVDDRFLEVSVHSWCNKCNDCTCM